MARIFLFSGRKGPDSVVTIICTDPMDLLLRWSGERTYFMGY
jgi:hypothetical protein